MCNCHSNLMSQFIGLVSKFTIQNVILIPNKIVGPMYIFCGFIHSVNLGAILTRSFDVIIVFIVIYE